MAEARYDFGVVTRLDADAVGQPGRRTFRLLVRSGTSSALVWIEKEQLLALAVAIERVLEQVAPDEVTKAEVATYRGPIQDFPLTPTLEFRVGQLQLGYDRSNEQFQLIASDAQDSEDENKTPLLTARLDYRAAGRLSQQIAALDMAGRPRCLVCGQPLGPEPHHCPLSNGQVH